MAKGTATTTTHGTPRKRPPQGGRPSELLRTLGHRQVDGIEVPITVLDRVTETLRGGGSMRDAAVRCGLSKSVLYNWVRDGARLQARLDAGTLTEADLAPEQAEAVRFLAATEQARTEGKLLLLGLVDRLGRGGIPQQVETVKVERVYAADGTYTEHEVERTTRTAFTLPDRQALTWRLSHGWPDEFADRVQVTGPDGGPVQLSNAERASTLAAELRAYQQGLADQAATDKAKR